ncbi:MAG: F0F1 ATP synthase subunit alpha [Eubacteriales bacterium]|nr:F0F1 ATP synthase subunit alpha [Eubacteriales bacterium]
MLREMQISQENAAQVTDIFQAVPQIKETLADPSVPLYKKHTVIEKVFPEKFRDILKLLCDNQEIMLWDEILESMCRESPVISEHLKAVLTYVTPPDPEQLEGIREFLKKKYAAKEVDIRQKQDLSLGGGFKLQAGTDEYDWTTKEKLRQLKMRLEDAADKQSGSTREIISILKEEIEDFDAQIQGREVGFVNYVGDGIANIDGVDHAQYGEILLFDNGTRGMVQDIRRDEIGCILFGREGDITEGTRVVRTGKRAGIPVGEQFLGRVINAMGAPVDGKGTIEAKEYRPMEEKAPGIVQRKSVSVPLETGILAIDSMFPIGRGQRELIIGDRQTGKTSIALDTILNQKGKDVICIYVAIGQKASTVAKLVNTLKTHDAMDYTTVVSATASEPASMQYIAPYAGTALAEYFMYQGKDVLIVYDDLSKHAVAYRALSLLLERSPGREAYPGDVFYLHSRLLERSSRLNEESGGGSITALPVIETQDGDVSAYIPTNVISITDGQIFLESNLFFSGMRPAVNVGLSVSRVGGAAQTKAMKKAAGSIRIDLAQFREMEVFTQFSSDLDETTREQLAYGNGLMELLKQPLCQPMSLHEQVLTLFLASRRQFLTVEKERIKEYQKAILAFFEEEEADIVKEIEETRELPDELQQQILKAAERFKSRWK